MYIVHMAAINAVRTVVFPAPTPTGPIVAMTGFLLTIAAAAMSVYFYEHPILSLQSQVR
jgi:peptidoglycan/LPS O-acetylase OafA/YrhL